MGEQEIYAAHSFEGDVCFDKSVLNMNQRSFGKDIEFSFRTFRFTGGNQTSDDQEQTISCELHLEPAADVPHEQASGCTCSDVEDCAGELFDELKNFVNFFDFRSIRMGRRSRICVLGHVQ